MAKAIQYTSIAFQIQSNRNWHQFFMEKWSRRETPTAMKNYEPCGSNRYNNYKFR